MNELSSGSVHMCSARLSICANDFLCSNLPTPKSVLPGPTASRHSLCIGSGAKEHFVQRAKSLHLDFREVQINQVDSTSTFSNTIRDATLIRALLAHKHGSLWAR